MNNHKLYTWALILAAFCAFLYREKLDASELFFKDAVKQLVMGYYNAHEPSDETHLLAQEAIQNLGITQEVIILESDTLAIQVRALRLPFMFVVVSSFKETEGHDKQKIINEKIYALYRALADIYYDHGGISRAKLLVPSLVLSFINFALGKKIDTLGSTAAINCNMGVVSAFALSILTIIGDCVEANQESIELACRQLIKQARVDVIEQELLTKRPAACFEANTAVRRKVLARCLHNNKQTSALERVLTQAKSVYDIELVGILKKMSAKLPRTSHIPTKGRTPVPRTYFHLK